MYFINYISVSFLQKHMAMGQKTVLLFQVLCQNKHQTDLFYYDTHNKTKHKI